MGMYRSTKNLNIKKVFSYLLLFLQIIMKKTFYILYSNIQAIIWLIRNDYYWIDFYN